MIHLPLGFFQSRNIMKDTQKQREPIFLPDLPRLNMDPYYMPVPMLFSKLEICY